MKETEVAQEENVCPFKEGEIAVFESWMRFEVYISRVMSIHIESWERGFCWNGPMITKATPEQKKLWYENDNYELVIEELSNY